MSDTICMRQVRTRAGLYTSAWVLGSLLLAESAWAQGPYVLGWGRNSGRQASPVPTNVMSGASAISAGYQHSLALKDGRVWAWGTNDYGQSTVPINAQADVSQIAGGGSFSLALKTNGSVVAWGAPIIFTNVPSSVTGGVTQVAAGEWHAMALKEGGIVAWGSNSYGQCTVPPELESGVSAIAGGGYYSLALKDGAVHVFGIPATNPLAASIRDVPPEAGSGVTAISAGKWHALALKEGGVIAWGTPYYDATNVPTAATSGVSAIAAGELFSIALKDDGTLVLWGDNTMGQLDVPSFASNGVTHISAGGGHCLSIGPALPPRFVSSNTPIAYQFRPYTNAFVLAAGDPAVHYYRVLTSWPSWLTLNETNGVLGGTPTNLLENDDFQIVASNIHGRVTNTYFVSVRELPLGPPVFVTTNPLPDGVVGAAYSLPIVITNGGTFSLTGNGQLPDGLGLTSAGMLTGTPTTVQSRFFEVLATNAVGFATNIYNLTINAPAGAPVFVTTNPLPSGLVGAPYSLQIETSNHPTGFSLLSGALPDGLGLTSGGMVTGTPVQIQSANFTLQATNMVGSTNATYDLQIFGAPAFLTESPLPDGVIDSPYSQQISATGDAVFSLVGGSLPDGLSLAGDGWVTGTPTSAGAFNFTVSATNDYGWSNRVFDLSVAAIPAFVTTNPLPSGQKDVPYSVQIVANNADSFSLFDGSLPAGLDLNAAGLLSGTPSAAGFFNFTVRATNEFGWSNRAFDLLIAGQIPPRILAVRSTNGNVRIDWTNYNATGSIEVHRATNIVVTNIAWSNLGVVVTSPWTNDAAPAPAYYKLHLVP